MQTERYQELEQRAESAGGDEIKKVEASARIRDVIAEMKAEGKAFELTAEEEALIVTFRKFKQRLTGRTGNFIFRTKRIETESRVPA